MKTPKPPTDAVEPVADDIAENTHQNTTSVQFVRDMLERHGVPKPQQAAFVAEFFGISRNAGHNRFANSSWTFDDVLSLANHFEESVAFSGALPEKDDGIPAIMRMGAVQVPCRIWLASTDSDPVSREPWALVAMADTAGTYNVMPRASAPDASGLPLTRLEVINGTIAAPRVAVFDDEPDVAEVVCANLKSAGIDARAFSSPEALLAAIRKNPFDGYVVDWLLPDGRTTLPLLTSIRSQPGRAALVLLTGKTREGSADPAEVGAAVSNFRAQLVEKPVLPPLLLSALLNDGLGSAGR